MPKGSPGVPKSPEQREKIAAALRGRPKTARHRAAIAVARRHSYSGGWTPQKSRDAVHRAVRRGEIPPATHCVVSGDCPGPYGYDHCGDPPYAFENRFVIQPMCNPCHQRLEAERRDGSGYVSRQGRIVHCERCGAEFYVSPVRSASARWCSRSCRYPGR